jgi:hypothetical protein
MCLDFIALRVTCSNAATLPRKSFRRLPIHIFMLRTTTLGNDRLAW